MSKTLEQAMADVESLLFANSTPIVDENGMVDVLIPVPLEDIEKQELFDTVQELFKERDDARALLSEAVGLLKQVELKGHVIENGGDGIGRPGCVICNSEYSYHGCVSPETMMIGHEWYDSDCPLASFLARVGSAK